MRLLRQIGTTGNLRMARMHELPVGQAPSVPGLNPIVLRAGMQKLRVMSRAAEKDLPRHRQELRQLQRDHVDKVEKALNAIER